MTLVLRNVFQSSTGTFKRCSVSVSSKPLLQAAGGTWVDAVQLVLHPQQGGFCLLVTAKVVGIGQAAIPAGLILVGEVSNDVATFMKLATENRTTISTILSHSVSQGLVAINE